MHHEQRHKKPTEIPTEIVDFQVDPGEMDYRRYSLYSENDSRFAEVLAAHTSDILFRGGYEYWSVTLNPRISKDRLIIRCSGDMLWKDRLPLPSAKEISFVAPIAADWMPVKKDLLNGTLFEHESTQWYVRFVCTKKVLSGVRWYQKSLRLPKPTLDPTGTYRSVEKLGDGVFWYADSLSPL